MTTTLASTIANKKLCTKRKMGNGSKMKEWGSPIKMKENTCKGLEKKEGEHEDGGKGFLSTSTKENTG